MSEPAQSKSKGGLSASDLMVAFSDTVSNLPRVQFAPMHVPLKRRLEALSILWYFTLWLQSHTIILLMMTRAYFWPLLLIYFTFIYFDDKCERGSRRQEWVCNLQVWKHIANYFPVTLSKEVDLDPNGKYLFAYHPHGIISNGVSGALMTNALGFSNMFPGVHLHPLTLSINFCWPLYRELAYALGFCTVSKKSIDYLFGIGHSCLIVVGGAEESLMARPNTADLFLTNRRGFVAVAIKNGASLVPVYGFGENEGFDLVIPEPDSLVIKAQKFLKSLVGFTLPLYHGRTVFTYNYGFLPKRSPINVVVGPPIHTKYDPNPSKELVELVHKEYMDALRDLYERNKEKYTPGDVIPELKFV